jgi:hypothetical protein
MAYTKNYQKSRNIFRKLKNVLSFIKLRRFNAIDQEKVKQIHFKGKSQDEFDEFKGICSRGSIARDDITSRSMSRQALDMAADGCQQNRALR